MPEEYEYTTGVCTDGTWDADVTVELSKVGGGTVGKAYEGVWVYRVSDADDSTLMEGADLHTGTPKTHAEVALIVYDFYEAEHGE